MRELDSERQSLVYNHHHELIAASETISAVRSLHTSSECLYPNCPIDENTRGKPRCRPRPAQSSLLRNISPCVRSDHRRYRLLPSMITLSAYPAYLCKVISSRWAGTPKSLFMEYNIEIHNTTLIYCHITEAENNDHHGL